MFSLFTLLAPTMAVTIAVDEDYGYVIIVGVLSIFFGYGLGGNVFFARRRFGVKVTVILNIVYLSFFFIMENFERKLDRRKGKSKY